MRVRGSVVEYDLKEAAIMLGLSAEELRKVVRKGKLRYFYKVGNEYKFHDANLENNCLLFNVKI